MRAWWAWVIVALVLFALIGCGGSSKDPEASKVMLFMATQVQPSPLLGEFNPTGDYLCTDGTVADTARVPLNPPVKAYNEVGVPTVYHVIVVRACVSFDLAKLRTDDVEIDPAWTNLGLPDRSQLIDAWAFILAPELGVYLSGALIIGTTTQYLIEPSEEAPVG